MVTITKQLGVAMSQQVERVNNNPDVLRDLLQEARDTIANLRQLLHQKDARIADLSAQIRLAQITAPRMTDEPVTDVVTGMQTYNGRPVITPAEAAQRTWLSRSTVNRYINSGHWEAVQIKGSNRWVIYADQPLGKKATKKSRQNTK